MRQRSSSFIPSLESKAGGSIVWCKKSRKSRRRRTNRCKKRNFYVQKELRSANASRIWIPLLAQLPLVGGVSWGGDRSIPYVLEGKHGGGKDGRAGEMWRNAMNEAASNIWESVHS
ncbi:hypothetical protein F4604DRAFT_1677433 [Suillus subluteus]|nr:hypothetical protein F4604DRAFT_1677433 [Suillus subluteus]